ncbi:MAG: hypothetical protein KAS32_05405 [Candidatus Peribacteraceae bacterium]|nr:hypothetical protein [Candidatus Peribacteraceae bacterium]
MRVSDFYRLELHWESVDKNKDDSCNLIGAYFSGPVLKHAEKIQPADKITLDLTPQYSRILTSYYFTQCEWGDIEYSNEIVILNNVILKGDFVNSISKLSNTDYILIDTSKHDGEGHVYHLVYRAYVVDKEGKEYNNA